MAGIGVAVLATLAMILAITAATAPSAQAQQPAVCEEYPDLGVCTAPTGDGGTNDNVGPGVTGTDGTGDSDGSLPFTGYPLTSLVLLLLGLLVAGLTVRAFVAVRSRLHDGATTG